MLIMVLSLDLLLQLFAPRDTTHRLQAARDASLPPQVPLLMPLLAQRPTRPARQILTRLQALLSARPACRLSFRTQEQRFV